MADVASPDDLYGLPLEEFTAARNALAKELARAGDKEGAAEVKKLVKPAKTAWALNQLARQRPDVVTKLLDSGRRLRRAQAKALDGDAGALRDATKAEQEQVGAALDAALELMGGGGAETAVAERLRRTLRAAATDPEAGALLKAGRLTADVETSGFGLDDLSLSPGGLPEEDEEPEGEQDQEDERARAQERRDALRDFERLANKAAAARERADRFREEAERAEQRAVEARQTADEAEEIAQEAEQFAAAAKKVADRLS